MSARLTLALCWTLAAPMVGQDPDLLIVTGARVWVHGGVTRVAIEVSGEFEYRWERLHNPERIFFDVLGARPARTLKRVQEAGGELLRRMRIAETMPGVTRVVLDLPGPVEFAHAQLSNPARLMIELRGAALALAVPPPSGAPAEIKPPMAESRPAQPNSRGETSLVRAMGLKVGRVVIDPGHGGHDQGAAGPRGLLEKDLVLDVAQRLGELIADGLGSEIVYTRADDAFVPLEGRTALAEQHKADLFISLHANSSAYPGVAGVETYFLNLTTDKHALDVAARENASAQKSLHEIGDLVRKITLHTKIEESRELAGHVQTAVHTVARRYNPAVKNRGVRQAPFFVLMNGDIPSVLCELGFLTNPREETLLRRAEHRQRVAEGIYRGVARYLKGLSHNQVARAKD